MSPAQILPGLAVCVPVTATTVVTGAALRRLVLPRWTGPIAVLASTVLGLSALLAVGHLLGTFGWLRPAPVVIVCVVVAAAAVVPLLRRPSPSGTPPPETSATGTAPATTEAPGRVDPVIRICATALMALVVAQLAYGVSHTLRLGLASFDTFDYHGPIAARFAHTGHITPLHFILPDIGTFTFHPADSELLNAIGMLGWHSDPLLPYLNIGWLAALLLAAWCFARARTSAVLTLMVTATLICVPIFGRGQSGTALNDWSSMFGLLAAVALLMHARDEPWAYAVAGMAAGIGLGIKLTVLFPVAFLTLCVPFLHRRRVAMSAAWSGGLLLTGSFWYLRNLFVAGSPLPAAHIPGLPHAEMRILDTRGFSAGHYFFDGRIWREVWWFAMRYAFGRLWLLLAAAVFAGIVIAVRRDARMERLLAVVALLSVGGYFITPTTALGGEGQPNPIIFAFNLRYAAPAMLLALVLFGDVAGRWPLKARRALAGSMLAVGIAAQTSLIWWDPTPFKIAAAALAGAAVLATLAIRRPVPRSVVAAAAAVLALAVVAVDAKLDPAPIEPMAQWAAHITDSRIAYAGLRKHYPLLGPRLDNTAEYAGLRLEHATFTTITDCPTWRRLLADGHFDYVVTADNYVGDQKPDAWTEGPGVTLEVFAKDVRIWRIHTPPDPADCPVPDTHRS